ncbi:DUF6090 family protein [Algoriphagus hitonicola]|uniref:Uncharacterized protein n=1 Tax=Algoriphagus hitonicola TaxID=435880 RepID=A0A1I2Q249_9BACT|nr:DUF6090 family protein [Algoriphagus hitonicola]SFG22358.1 hypothetical protein SAMN04487988_10277 [Algoriphagus hitonicola]
MLKFFRKIRQKLLEENKISSYLIYAVGEIFLVVIGILIALQVSNANQRRLDNIKRNEYIIRIKGDIESDLKQLDQLAYGLGKENAENIDRYFGFFTKGGQTIETFVDSALRTPLNKFRYLPNRHSFEDMKSSGNIQFLTDNQRSALADLIAQQDFTIIMFEKIIDQINMEDYSARGYLDMDDDPSSFFQTLGIKINPEDQIKGLHHLHNRMRWSRSLGLTASQQRNAIQDQSNKILALFSKK